MNTRKIYRWRSLFTGRLLPTTYFLLLITSCLLLASCKQLNVYEKNTPIPKYEWQSDFVVKGSFTITDTLTPYNLFIVLRHTDAYKYNNIWLNLGLQNPGDSMSYQKINLPLGNDASGWEGTGMNDIWELRSLLNTEKPQRFRRAGIYNFSIAQIMRDNPLLHIMSAGLRIENPGQK
jgi:gliding motility-associated lipoprotein GldH